MNKSDSDRIHELCSRIAVEEDPDKFTMLVTELNRILSTRLQNEIPPENG